MLKNYHSMSHHNDDPLTAPAVLFLCFFSTVQFNRCVTSQMIKWFSNFREFFYIQMERFARQAVREALTRSVWFEAGTGSCSAHLLQEEFLLFPTIAHCY